MIPLPKIAKLVERKGNWARFEIEPLYPGFGVTVGNGLRRVLLSSLEGAAITEVKIQGVSHEFSTIPGVLEDVIVILQNLKKLRFKVFTEEPQKGLLQVSGEKEVKGSDFKLPTQVELVNKDAPVATLTSKDAKLQMQIKIEKGVGYEPVERRGREGLKPGVIALDAIFTPIRKVSFRTKNVRVGKRTDFDKLILDIETDGTILPQEALKQASTILKSYFSFLVGKMEQEIEREKERKKELKKETKVEDLGISKRTANVLKENGIKTVAGILMRKEQTLRELKGIGPKSIREIKTSLSQLGFELNK